jgi:hypothetical protein
VRVLDEYLRIAIYSFLTQEAKSVLKLFCPVYWLEATVIVAFGIAWLTKGEKILKVEV